MYLYMTYKNIMSNTMLHAHKWIRGYDVHCTDDINNTDNNNNPKLHMSLTTIPPRFLSDALIQFLKYIDDQIVKPDQIFISIPFQYLRQFNYHETDIVKQIDKINSMYPNVTILRTHDYGPGTKLLGLLEYDSSQHILNDDDIILVVDDDQYYHKNFVHLHKLAHQIYGSDIVANNQAIVKKLGDNMLIGSFDEIFYGEHKSKLYGWLGFSITKKASVNCMEFFETVTLQYPDSIFHDDALFTIYAKVNNLNIIGTNMYSIVSTPWTPTDKIRPLHQSVESSQAVRKNIENDLEKEFSAQLLAFHESDHGSVNGSVNAVNGSHITSSGATYHQSVTWFGDNIQLVTISLFDKKTIKCAINCVIKNQGNEIMIKLTPKYMRQTYAIKF